MGDFPGQSQTGRQLVLCVYFSWLSVLQKGLLIFSFQQADRSSCHFLFLYGVGCDVPSSGTTGQMSMNHEELLPSCTPGASLRKGKGNSSMVSSFFCRPNLFFFFFNGIFIVKNTISGIQCAALNLESTFFNLHQWR